MELSHFNQRWQKYKELWEVDREEFIVYFLKDKPSIYDFENVLKKYNLIEAELATEEDEFRLVPF